MKKEQKIIELRTAAKLKVADLKTKIAVARSEAAEKRARMLCDRAADLKGVEIDSAERFDILAKSKADLAWIEAHLAATVAECKLEIQQTKADCEQQCAAAEDDPKTMMELPKQETVYCDGSEHAARIVARRLINKMPHIPDGGSMDVNVIQNDNGEFFVSASAISKNNGAFVVGTFSKEIHNEYSEAEFIREAREKFKLDENKSNSHVAEPFASALNAVFGGNPLDDFPTLKRKEGGNE